MTVTLSGQLSDFGIALLMGAALGVVYDIFKVLRLIGLNFKIAAFIEDILFFLIATVTVFSYYMQITDGKFRIFPLIAAVLGFALYSISIEKPIFFLIRKLYELISKIFSFIYKKIFLFALKKLGFLLKKVFYPVGKFFKKLFAENIVNFLKKLLPKSRKMLYNSKGIYKRKKGKSKNAQREQKSAEKAFFC